MRIAYLHASKFGNGAFVAAEVERLMALERVTVEVRHIREVEPTALMPADLYVFSSPGRMGKPIRRMRRFLAKLDLPAGTKYAVLTTEMAPRPDKKTGRIPSEEERAEHQRVIPIMNELLQRKGLVKVAEGSVYVTGMKGPLEADWRHKVEAFVGALRATDGVRRGDDARSDGSIPGVER
jgi:hypothetical protein